MNILYDSWDANYKSPFGPLRAGEKCYIRLKIPVECAASAVALEAEGLSLPLERYDCEGDYDCFGLTFSLPEPGLWFYCFHIRDKNGEYDLFRRVQETNMMDGERWQLSVIPADYQPPEAFRGAVYYQIFPDRFARCGECDLTGKLTPYTLGDFAEFVPSAPDASDFAGGNLAGIVEKLDYLAALGVQIIYLNPIFMAASNHRYDTADYSRVDPMLGSEADFVKLCESAHARNMKIVLDGVFSHTGRNSVYFDGEGRFGGGAVSEGANSRYYKWYEFQEFPGKYTSWWGIDSLPCVNENDPDYREFLLGERGILAKWLSLGVDGFRLDVADELPDEFIRVLRRRVKTIKPQAVVIGEVWEDASNKISYGVRRRYFTGAELDGVINYPFRKAILDFCGGADDGAALARTVMTLAENYPVAALDCTMLVLGTHDTPRIGTLLPEKKARHAAAFLQFTLPGSPVIYYGDEAGLTGGGDPMCRLPFPWGREDEDLQALYRMLAAMKRRYPALQKGDVRVLHADSGVFRFVRTWQGLSVRCFVDRNSGEYGIAANCFSNLQQYDIIEINKILV